jgi:hypothetical protein
VLGLGLGLGLELPKIDTHVRKAMQVQENGVEREISRAFRFIIVVLYHVSNASEEICLSFGGRNEDIRDTVASDVVNRRIGHYITSLK